MGLSRFTKCRVSNVICRLQVHNGSEYIGVVLEARARCPSQCSLTLGFLLNVKTRIAEQSIYSIACVDCRQPIDLSSDQWTDAVNATVDYYKAIIF